MCDPYEDEIVDDWGREVSSLDDGYDYYHSNWDVDHGPLDDDDIGEW